MSSSTPEFLDRFRQPEYTGENRCTPCTIVNSAIAIVLAAVVGVGLATVATAAAGAGGAAVVLVASALSIALRGYLVPGTPTLTKRYFPDRVLAWFEKEPPEEYRAFDREAQGEAAEAAHAEASTDEEGPSYWDVEITGERVEEILQDAGALEPCEEFDDLCVTDDFRDVWWGHVQDVRDSDAGREELARMVGDDPDDLTFEDHDGAFVAKRDLAQLGKWESEAAFFADMGAARAFEEVYADEWDDLHMRERSAALNGIRVFLDTCPVCEGPVTLGEETVESCCREYEVMAVACDDCEARLFEHRSGDDKSPHP